jgi:hypothetical protein
MTTATQRQERLTIVPLALEAAADMVDALHRHHKRPRGHKFSLGVVREGGALCGVAIVGRPVARCFDKWWCLEVTRVATDGTPNACSTLYGRIWRVAKESGYLRVITYTQEGESGASLRAVNWTPIAELRPRTGWDTPSRHREDHGTDGVARILWEQRTKNAPELPSIEELRSEIRHEIQCAAIGCGRLFAPHVGRGRPARYCSPACRARAHRANARPTKPAAVLLEVA